MAEKFLEFAILIAKLFGKKHDTAEEIKRKEMFLESLRHTEDLDYIDNAKIELNFKDIYGLFLPIGIIKIISSSQKCGEIFHYMEKGSSGLRFDGNKIVCKFKNDNYFGWFLLGCGALLMALSLYPLFTEQIHSWQNLLMSFIFFSIGLLVLIAATNVVVRFSYARKAIQLYAQLISCSDKVS